MCMLVLIRDNRVEGRGKGQGGRSPCSLTGVVTVTLTLLPYPGGREKGEGQSEKTADGLEQS